MAYQFIPAAHHWDGREGYSPRYLIIHGTAGGHAATDIANYFADPTTQASTHYVIGQDGTIVQCVQETDAAWANGGFSTGHDVWWDTTVNPNLVSIAIEHVKPSTDNSDVLTPEQQAASFSLVREICKRWGIPTRWADANGGITGHYSIDPVNRSRCPGPYPWDELFNYLQGETMLELTDPFAVAFFEPTSDGKWHCKSTGCDIRGAVLDFYRRLNGALRLPIANEIQIDPTYAGTIQHFEAGTIVYDPEHKWDGGQGTCYLPHADWTAYSNLVAVAKYNDIEKQLADAQAKLAAIPANLQATIANLQNRLTQIKQIAEK